MWDGKFSPYVGPISKHRDFQHDTFAEHEFANGGTYEVLFPVMCDRNPIDGHLLEPSVTHYVVDFNLHTGETYYYLVRAESDRSEPERDNVSRTIDAYARNPVSGGRNPFDYIDERKTSPEALAALSELYEPPRLTPTRVFW